MLGVAAVTALPSEVWPFKKIFVPAASRVDILDMRVWEGHSVELESFLKEIPDLLFRNTSIYELMKSRKTIAVTTMEPAYRIPVHHLSPGEGFLGLSRSSYPGRLGRNLLHAPATPENIVRLANELEHLSKQKS